MDAIGYADRASLTAAGSPFSARVAIAAQDVAGLVAAEPPIPGNHQNQQFASLLFLAGPDSPLSLSMAIAVSADGLTCDTSTDNEILTRIMVVWNQCAAAALAT
jgi:hypothetical protein